MLLTISTAGLPVAVSKLVSEANALGRHNQVRRTFQLSVLLFLGLGVLSFLVMYFKADALAGLMNDDKAAAGIRALAGRVSFHAARAPSKGAKSTNPAYSAQLSGFSSSVF